MGSVAQGVALGFTVPPLQGEEISPDSCSKNKKSNLATQREESECAELDENAYISSAHSSCAHSAQNVERR